MAYATSSAAYTGATSASSSTWFTTKTKNRIIGQNTVKNIYTKPFKFLSPGFAPFDKSAVVITTVTNTHFDDPILVDRPLISKVDLIGGIAPSWQGANWFKGLTTFWC